MHSDDARRTISKRLRFGLLIGTPAATVALVAALLPAAAQGEVVAPHVVTPHAVTPHVVTPPAPSPPPAASPPPVNPPPAAGTPAAVPPAPSPTNTAGSPGLIVGCGHREPICEEERILAEERKQRLEFQEWIEEQQKIEVEELEAERKREQLEKEQAGRPRWNFLGQLLCPLFIVLDASAQAQLDREIELRGAVFDDEDAFQEAAELDETLRRLSCLTKVEP